ncbi:MAG TPA: hypothetical protein VEA58_05635 [Anaerovoracaceae bacterium]|nr:hypothetical protein [Anaerovoracaceae bacterium]
MSQKKLQVEGITNELAGASLYFNPPSKPLDLKPTDESPTPLLAGQISRSGPLREPRENGKLWKHANMIASNHASMAARNQVRNSASMLSSTHNNKLASGPARKQDDFIETIRKSVKKVGREALFVRLTPEEKDELRTIVYQLNQLYRGKGGETSENEVSRIALKFLLEDHKKNGEHSILSITQKALKA